MIEVSVIIPARNEESSIGKCIESINLNAYSVDRYEVIVVDNGSTDSTVSLAKSYGVAVYIKPGLNVSALRNYGASMAKGNILAFVDADCTVASDWLSEAEKYFNIDDIACFGSTPGIPDNPTWVQKTWAIARWTKEEEVETAWLESMNMFIRKALFMKVGGFNESLVTCEDVDISYRLVRYGKIMSIKRIRAIHHGEARTLAEFYRKERWRGRSNYKGVVLHRFRLDEMPSIVMPVYYGLLPLMAAMLFMLDRAGLSAGALLLWQLSIMFIVYLKIRGGFDLTSYFRLLILYNVYYCARLAAIFN